LDLPGVVGGSHKERGKAMAKTYRDVAIEQMIATVEEAMSRVIDWWGWGELRLVTALRSC
jgi:hypothetical protein